MYNMCKESIICMGAQRHYWMSSQPQILCAVQVNEYVAVAGVRQLSSYSELAAVCDKPTDKPTYIHTPHSQTLTTHTDKHTMCVCCVSAPFESLSTGLG